MDNESGRDLDFLVVTLPGRLWLCRGMAMLLVRLARRLGDELCPNYFITTQALAFPSQDLYSAHELVQMAPLFDRGEVGECELDLYRLDIADRVDRTLDMDDVFVVKASNDLYDRVRLSYIREKLVAEAFAL
jgi:hypothetical protein